jgi:type 1 glutamine amidotransferase
MRKSIVHASAMAALALTAWTSGVHAAAQIKVLLVDGPQKYHKYQQSSPVMKEILEKSGPFTVDHVRRDDKDANYKPDFESYDVVVINEGFGSKDWPAATRAAFEKYVAAGGGMVSYHAANNAWPKWAEYNKMTGVGGWSGRNEKSGPYLYTDASGKVVRDASKGKGGSHGPQHEFEIVVRAKDHPIMKGLPPTFMHGPDELYDRLRGPAENVTILATAHSSKDKRGTGREEPMLMTVTYEKGRIFHTTLGHGAKQLKMGSFVTTFLRGTEWAATGKVTIPVPREFPKQAF